MSVESNRLGQETSPYLAAAPAQSRALAGLVRGNPRSRQAVGKTRIALGRVRRVSLVPCDGA